VIQDVDRYSRLTAIEWWNQARLRDAKILVAGAGALGNEVLKNLALIGIGTILIVDFDTVEITNLSRSLLFRAEDISQPKALVAARRLRELNPDIRVEGIHGDVVWDVGLGALHRCDAVIGCLDNRQARLGLNRMCWKAQIPWIDGALDIMAGQVRVFMPPDGACYECSFSAEDYRDLNLRYSCQLLSEQGKLGGGVPTTPTGASFIAALQVQELLKLLHGRPILAGHEIEYDGWRHRYQVTELARNDNCLGHDSICWDEVISLPGVRADSTTAGELLQRVRADIEARAYIHLDREVITGFTCPVGHRTDRRPRPQHAVASDSAQCPICGAECRIDLTHRIDDDRFRDVPLRELGIPAGHVLLGRFGQKQIYYQLSGDL
jgi:adenylyltransferase/sulfurtransferase